MNWHMHGFILVQKRKTTITSTATTQNKMAPKKFSANWIGLIFLAEQRTVMWMANKPRNRKHFAWYLLSFSSPRGMGPLTVDVCGGCMARGLSVPRQVSQSKSFIAVPTNHCCCTFWPSHLRLCVRKRFWLLHP